MRENIVTVTAKAAAQAMGVSVQTIYRRIARGVVKATKVARRWAVEMTDRTLRDAVRTARAMRSAALRLRAPVDPAQLNAIAAARQAALDLVLALDPAAWTLLNREATLINRAERASVARQLDAIAA